MKKARRQTTPKRGDLWIVNFDPTIGSEIRKTRPALVLQNDVGNSFSAVTIIAALSSHDGGVVYPTEVPIEPPEGGLEKRSVVLLNQIRTVDKQRLIARIGTVTSHTMRAVERALLISLGLIDM
ncbi:MAG: type II toxin-antitoxin system PemK/MazF family toxin [Patescibacteria group bacterium]|mgnify:CR=1 FL=1